jgi:hypothetical protein
VPVTNPLEANCDGCSTKKPWREANGVRANAGQIARSGARRCAASETPEQKGLDDVLPHNRRSRQRTLPQKRRGLERLLPQQCRIHERPPPQICRNGQRYFNETANEF